MAMLPHCKMNHLVFKAFLCFSDNVKQKFSPAAPFCNARQIIRSSFIIQDKWGNSVPQTFFEHQKSANSAIPIPKRRDHFKIDIEIQNIRNLRILDHLVFFYHLV